MSSSLSFLNVSALSERCFSQKSHTTCIIMPHAQRRWGWGGIGAGQRNECDDSIAHQAIAHRAIAHTHLVDVDHDDLLHGRVLEHLPCRRSLPAAANEDLARIRMVQKGGVDEALVVHPLVCLGALKLAVEKQDLPKGTRLIPSKF